MNSLLKTLVLQTPYAYFLCTGAIQSQLKHRYVPNCFQNEGQTLESEKQSFAPQQ